MDVWMVGSGIMGSQIACEYALGGHRVTVLARHVDRARGAVADALDVAASLGPIAPAADVADRLQVARLDERTYGEPDLIIESIDESLSAKVDVLGPLAAAAPGATIATNTSSLSIDELGMEVGAPDRLLGTHYWNPPLLMPQVEVIRGSRTNQARVTAMVSTLAALGKSPIRVERDVAGFVWNRLQFALLREAVALVESGVADVATVDAVVSDGLARRWRYGGPFVTAALGGAATFEKVAENLFPVLSNAADAAGLADAIAAVRQDLATVRRRRDAGLARELRSTAQE